MVDDLRQEAGAQLEQLEQLAELERQRAQSVTTVTPKVETVKTVNITLGSERVRVLADDADALIRALENARSTAL